MQRTALCAAADAGRVGRQAAGTATPKKGDRDGLEREDDEKAYTTYDDIVGRSMRRGTRKAVKVLTLGLLGGDDPVTGLAKDAAGELATKVIPRSLKNSDD